MAQSQIWKKIKSLNHLEEKKNQTHQNSPGLVVACGPWPLPLQCCLCPLAEWPECSSAGLPAVSRSRSAVGGRADARARAASRGSREQARRAAVPVRVSGSAERTPDGITGGLGRWRTAAAPPRCPRAVALGRSVAREVASQRKPEAQRLGQSHGGNKRKKEEYRAKFMWADKVPKKFWAKIQATHWVRHWP